MMHIKSVSERDQFDDEVHIKLKAAEKAAKTTDKRLSHDEVFSVLRRKLMEKAAEMQ
ncbi:MAG TPA: hypothetical protein VN441_05645 [Syntrophomonas sp.]|nr:hypothetical protein [Syntrophomonas sp.]